MESTKYVSEMRGGCLTSVMAQLQSRKMPIRICVLRPRDSDGVGVLSPDAPVSCTHLFITNTERAVEEETDDYVQRICVGEEDITKEVRHMAPTLIYLELMDGVALSAAHIALLQAAIRGVHTWAYFILGVQVREGDFASNKIFVPLMAPADVVSTYVDYPRHMVGYFWSALQASFQEMRATVRIVAVATCPYNGHAHTMVTGIITRVPSWKNMKALAEKERRHFTNSQIPVFIPAELLPKKAEKEHGEKGRSGGHHSSGSGAGQVHPCAQGAGD